VAPHNYPLKIASDESGRTSLTEPERLQVGQSAYAKLPEHQRRVATPTLLGSFGSIGRGALRLRKLNGKRSIGVRRCLNTDQRRVSPGWIALDNVEPDFIHAGRSSLRSAAQTLWRYRECQSRPRAAELQRVGDPALGYGFTAAINQWWEVSILG
jgi:hypothetical protein